MRDDEDWNALVSLLPPGWAEAAVEHGALTRLRGFASAEQLLRVLLIHLALGCSLRETAVRARRGGIADVSDVAILKRLRNSEDWLHHLCRGLCGKVHGIPRRVATSRRRLLAVDATFVSEPGSTGTDWRLHYALELSLLKCVHFELTNAEGGELLSRFPVRAGDLVLADRAYYRVAGILGVLAEKADVLVRVMLGHENLSKPGARERFDFLVPAEKLKEGKCREWPAEVWGMGGARVRGRLCLMRRSEEVAELERAKMMREAKKKGRTVSERTLRAASFVGLFTTVPKKEYSAADLFEMYRFRWQIEIAFKRLKSIGGLGHLPKHDPASCRAWLYGKLLVGLLSERIARCDFFPQGPEREM